MIERQVIVTWYAPEEKLPEDDEIVVATVSGKSRGVILEHSMELASFSKSDGWVLESMIFDHTLKGAWLTVHAWADLEPYKGGK